MLAALERDPASATLDDKQRALVGYALKLTLTPERISERDVQELRDAGLSDAAIHDVAAITAYFNFVNRMASGLGVELEKSANSGDD